MLRQALVGCVAVLLVAGFAPAAEVKGKVKSVDAEKNTVTVTVADKDQAVAVAKDAEVFTLGKAKKGQPAPKSPVSGGLTGVKVGDELTITTESKDGKDVATAIQVGSAAKKKKDK